MTQDRTAWLRQLLRRRGRRLRRDPRRRAPWRAGRGRRSRSLLGPPGALGRPGPRRGRRHGRRRRGPAPPRLPRAGRGPVAGHAPPRRVAASRAASSSATAAALPLPAASCGAGGAVAGCCTWSTMRWRRRWCGEAARVLGAGGRLVTTVNKNASSRAVGSGQPAASPPRPVTDDPRLLGAVAAELGLEPSGATSYVAQGQARCADVPAHGAGRRPAPAPGPR